VIGETQALPCLAAVKRSSLCLGAVTKRKIMLDTIARRQCKRPLFDVKLHEFVGTIPARMTGRHMEEFPAIH
jgi:hypothetical protein